MEYIEKLVSSNYRRIFRLQEIVSIPPQFIAITRDSVSKEIILEIKGTVGKNCVIEYTSGAEGVSASGQWNADWNALATQTFVNGKVVFRDTQAPVGSVSKRFYRAWSQ